MGSRTTESEAIMSNLEKILETIGGLFFFASLAALTWLAHVVL